MSRSPVDIARAIHAALEAGQHGPELGPFFTEDVTTREHPNLIKPTGGLLARDRMLKESASGAGLLAKQTYDLHSAINHGNTAILRLTWRGVIARNVGQFRAGQELVAHIAQFIETWDGKVASIETFDCYEPFG